MSLILLVEDEPNIRENSVELMELNGYDVLVATNGKEGLELAIEHKPDVIVSDVMMPEMNGFELLDALKSDEDLKKIPVIFCSASVQKKDVEEAWNRGISAYITKPFDEEDLFKEIDKFLA